METIECQNCHQDMTLYICNISGCEIYRCVCGNETIEDPLFDPDEESEYNDYFGE